MLACTPCLTQALALEYSHTVKMLDVCWHGGYYETVGSYHHGPGPRFLSMSFVDRLLGKPVTFILRRILSSGRR